jgi:putative transposase
MRKVQLVNNEFYHIYNRGVEKRNIFNNERDYYRFIFQMYACNIGSPVNSIFRKEINFAAKNILKGEEVNEGLIIERHAPLVDILVFCLMKNHFHFILQQRVKGGISKFMQKLGTAYTMYFNLSNERSGSLFQGQFKAIHIDNENYLLHLSRYIHLNPLDFIEPQWREKGVRDWKKATQFLNNFWSSSYLDYIGFRQSKLIDKNIFNYYFDFFNKEGIKNYKEFLERWAVKDLSFIQSFILE